MEDLTLGKLGQFTGTEAYHNMMGVYVTDGIIYLMENGYSWFVIDAVAVIKYKLSNQEFLSIKLKVRDGKAVMTITDGNKKKLYSQKYEWTNAEVNELQLFYVDGVLMLPSEY